nr:aminotransferase class I/II-fold pyridoxal phosphate-dependent enzyme [Paenibacillus larvae]
MEKAFGHSDILFLGQPNNPTGRLLPEQVNQLIRENRHPVILDEAFLDFHPSEQKLTLFARRHPAGICLSFVR